MGIGVGDHCLIVLGGFVLGLLCQDKSTSAISPLQTKYPQFKLIILVADFHHAPFSGLYLYWLGMLYSLLILTSSFPTVTTSFFFFFQKELLIQL